MSPRVSPTLAIVIAGDVATIGGVASPGQVVGLMVDNIAVVHRTRSGDTPELIAATLGSYLRTRRPVVVAGATVAVPDAHILIGRVAVDQTITTENRRQSQDFRISIWCPTPELRDLVGGYIDQALSALVWISIDAVTTGKIRGQSSILLDQSQNANLYRRELVYQIEYPTISTSVVPTLIFGDLVLSPPDAGSVQTLLA